ncbi:MAG: putative ABC transporter permease [Lachnospiraceae bacterium]|nr:putative ABC transporter permease [Lachnospiraceae bacterium]
MTILQILWFFMIYSLIGWGIEVSYHAVTMGKVVNRGFLNGPICPVYGCGVLSVLAVVRCVGEKLGYSGDIEMFPAPLLFAVGICFATTIELAAGALLDVLFHARWWDYSKEKFNFRGYICLRFSIIWGLAIAFVLRVIHPGISRLTDLVPEQIAWVILVLLYITLVLDLVMTTLSVLKLNKQLEMMEELQRSILRISDGMSEVIAEGTMQTVKLLEEKQDKAKEEYKQRRLELEAKIEHIQKSILYHRLFGMGRLIRAFPEMRHRLYQDMIDRIHDMIGKGREE